MSIFRKAAPDPERVPHYDSRVEAELQRVLGLQHAVTRTEDRLADVRVAQRQVDEDRRQRAGLERTIASLTTQAKQLRAERAELEESLLVMHQEISARLTALGDDALLLHGPPATPAKLRKDSTR